MLKMEHALIVTCDFCKKTKEVFFGEFSSIEVAAAEAATTITEKGWTVNEKTLSMKCPSCNHGEYLYNETSHLRP